MRNTPDPLVPISSRFPLTCPRGRLGSGADAPSGEGQRPFGMSRAVRPVESDRHSKRPTQKSRTKQTAITNDGKVEGYETDVEHYVEMDEE